MQPAFVPMRQSLEAMIASLSKVSVFAETPTPVLARVASLLELVEVPAGTHILSKGEPGDCMYIILEGKVCVHDGNLVFNYLGPHEVFGEISLLDLEMRTATVTAEVDTALYRLDQQSLYELMDSQPEVAHGIMHVLSRYLRGLVRDMADDFEYMRQFARVISAAQAVEAGTYEPEMIADVATRTDALGQLARVFQQMAQEVIAREAHLRQQVQSLQIQIDRKQSAHQVEQITETDYFRNLQRVARTLRQQREC